MKFRFELTQMLLTPLMGALLFGGSSSFAAQGCGKFLVENKVQSRVDHVGVKEVINSIVTGDGDKIVTSFDTIAKALRAIGLSPEEASQMLGVIELGKKLAIEQKDPYLLPAVEHIALKSSGSIANENLLVCMFGKGCQIDQTKVGNDGFLTAFAYVARNFVVPTHKENELKFEENIDSAFGLARTEILFLTPFRDLPGPDGLDHLLDWMGQFFRGASQSATLELLSSWILKNQVGKHYTAPLYDRWVKLENGKYTIDNNFFSVLMASRIQSANFAIRRSVALDIRGDRPHIREYIQRLEQAERNQAIHLIKFWTGGDQVLSQFNVNAGNVFEVGLQLAKELGE